MELGETPNRHPMLGEVLKGRFEGCSHLIQKDTDH
jgi:hypothetical protein